MLSVAPGARVSRLADIEESSRGTHIRIEAGAIIDAFVKIRSAGGTGDVVIGAGTVINSGCVLYTGNGIHIGAHVLIAANCTIAPTNHAFDDRSRPIRDQGFAPARGGVVIGDDCWIGAGSVLLDGAVLGQGCVVGAMSLVNGALPSWSISYGRPARVMRWRNA